MVEPSDGVHDPDFDFDKKTRQDGENTRRWIADAAKARAKRMEGIGSLDVPKWLMTLEGELKTLTADEEREAQLSRLTEIAKTYAGEDKIISSLELAEQIKTRPEIPKIKTGMTGLDDIIGGFVKKQLVVIAAPTKNGKTSFCIDLTARFKDKNPLWLPFEEPAEELIQKFLDRKEEPPLFYTPERIIGNTMVWIEKKIIEAKAKYNSEVVFIDHLHFVVPFSSDRQDLLIGQTMRELKKLAKQWNVLIFLIAHLKKTKLDTAPDLEDLRDSSFIAQEADTVIMLWRKTKREQGEVVISNETVVSVQANRRTGKTGNITLVFDNGRFIEKSEKESKELDEFIHGKSTKGGGWD